MHSFNRLVSVLILGCLLQAGTALAAPPNQKSPSAESAKPDAAPVDINTATEKDLEALPHVGPSRAAAIVELRNRMKGFRKVEDLMRVRGIGRKTFRKLRPLITLTKAK